MLVGRLFEDPEAVAREAQKILKKRDIGEITMNPNAIYGALGRVASSVTYGPQGMLATPSESRASYNPYQDKNWERQVSLFADSDTPDLTGENKGAFGGQLRALAEEMTATSGITPRTRELAVNRNAEALFKWFSKVNTRAEGSVYGNELPNVAELM